MNIFERIQPNRLEDFCTDILVGILQKDENLLRRFCIDVLNIPENEVGESLRIESQGHHKANEICTKQSFIDIEISGNGFLCFLEMKVESKQNNSQCTNERQLPKYNTALLRKNYANSYLRFCTKYNEFVPDTDKKDFLKKKGYFEQLRWHKIYKFLSVNFNDDNLVNEFLEFLDSKNMSDRMSIDNKSLELSELSFGQSLKFLTKLTIVLNEVKQKIEESNLIKVRPNNEYLDLARNRYGLHYEYIEMKSPETSLFIGFDFNNKNEENNINKVVWLWSSNYSLSNYKFDIPKQNCKQVENLKEETLENILNWFLQNEVLKQIL